MSRLEAFSVDELLAELDRREPDFGDDEAWFQTWSGVAFMYDSDDPAQILLPDVARSLSRLARFLGHTRRIYTVAEHALNAADLAMRLGLSPLLQLCALHHDTAEAFLADIPGPIKRRRGAAMAWLERRVEKRVAARFGLPNDFADHPEVKRIDLALLEAERRALYGPTPRPWKTTALAEPEALMEAVQLVDAERSLDSRGLMFAFQNAHAALAKAVLR